MKKIMLIGVGWEQIPLLEKAKEMNLKTIVTTAWDKSKLNADVIYEVDSRDLTKLEEIFLQEKPDAVLADECDYSMYAVAYLTEKYNLSGPSLYALTVTNNKFLQRESAFKGGIKQPKYEMCWNLDMALIAATKIGFPVILKPLDNRGSIGVFTVQDEVDLKKYWYISVANSHSRMCIIEEFIEGQVITVDGFRDTYKFNPLSISTKHGYSESKHVGKIHFFPGGVEISLQEEIFNITKKLCDVINITFGFVHVEYIIQEHTNEVYLIEIANRGGGVHISNIILPAITGIDLMKEYIKMSLAENVEIYWDGKYVSKALVYFLNPKGERAPEEVINQYPNGLLSLYVKKREKSISVVNSGALGRLGLVTLAGSDFEILQGIGSDIENNLKVVDNEYVWRQKDDKAKCKTE